LAGRLPLQPHHLAGHPGLGHQAVAGAQRQGLACGQHMVFGLTAAGHPDPALQHPQLTIGGHPALPHTAQARQGGFVKSRLLHHWPLASLCCQRDAIVGPARWGVQ
jgi:hypothetical protein